MNKKIIMLLASFLLVFNITACSSSNDKAGEGSESTESNTNDVVETSDSEEVNADQTGVEDFSA